MTDKSMQEKRDENAQWRRQPLDYRDGWDDCATELSAQNSLLLREIVALADKIGVERAQLEKMRWRSRFEALSDLEKYPGKWTTEQINIFGEWRANARQHFDEVQALIIEGTHACQTGDCDHDKQTECDDELREALSPKRVE